MGFVSPDLVAALRADMPAAPSTLRAQVAGITAAPPPPRRFSTRRLVAFAVPSAAALSLLVASVVGLGTAISPPDDRAAAPVTRPATDDRPTDFAPLLERRDRAAPPQAAEGGDAAAPAPSGTRAQDYRAALTLLVDGTDELSATTQKALRTARRLGGYVVAVDYSTPEPGEGSAAVRLKIPISRVQAAIVELSGLGRILSQSTQIADLQGGLDELTRRIRRLERRAASLRGAERERVLAEIAALRKQRTELNRRAAYASVDLNLTTREPQAAPTPPGRFERAVDDALGILLFELAILTYALIVAAPLALLLVAAFAGVRTYRHHADQRLLERA